MHLDIAGNRFFRSFNCSIEEGYRSFYLNRLSAGCTGGCLFQSNLQGQLPADITALFFKRRAQPHDLCRHRQPGSAIFASVASSAGELLINCLNF